MAQLTTVIKTRNRSVKATFQIVENDGMPLIGLETGTALGLFFRKDAAMLDDVEFFLFG